MTRLRPHLYEHIWSAVERIPRGRVATYGDIARLSGVPGQARLVGYALHRIPPGMHVPWHRVINIRGTISLRGSAGRTQRALLRNDGVKLEGDRIDLQSYRWRPDRKVGWKN